MSSTGFTLSELARVANADMEGSPECQITGLAPLASAGAGDLAFLGDKKYRKHLANTQASAVLVAPDFVAECPVIPLVSKNPEVSFAKVAQLFVKQSRIACGIHPTAVVAESCQIDVTASIGANCVLGERVVVGAKTKIMPGTVIGDDCCIGDQCLLYSNVTLYHQVHIANRVIVHSGAVRDMHLMIQSHITI